MKKKEIIKKYGKKDYEKILQQSREWRKNNKIPYKDWSQEKKDRQKIFVKKWRENNKEHYLASCRKYAKKRRKKNGDIMRLYDRTYYKKTHSNMQKVGWDAKQPYEKKQYTHCLKCKTNKRPHSGKGLCNLCYEKTRKAYKAKWFQKQQKKKKGRYENNQ